jgi:solute carrier family 35, member E1
MNNYNGWQANPTSSQLASTQSPLSNLAKRLSLTPTSLKFIFLCLLWYTSSALSNNSAKQILTVFKYPVTLTFVQFGFISSWCLILAVVQQLRGRNSVALFGAKSGIRNPTRQIILTTVPLSLFQIAGHVFGSLATSQIPVSVVHTVKVLLFWDQLI